MIFVFDNAASDTIFTVLSYLATAPQLSLTVYVTVCGPNLLGLYEVTKTVDFFIVPSISSFTSISANKSTSVPLVIVRFFSFQVITGGLLTKYFNPDSVSSNLADVNFSGAIPVLY